MNFSVIISICKNVGQLKLAQYFNLILMAVTIVIKTLLGIVHLVRISFETVLHSIDNFVEDSLLTRIIFAIRKHEF